MIIPVFRYINFGKDERSLFPPHQPEFIRILHTMNADKKRIDIINLLLEDCILAYPLSTFIISIYKQYQERGWLTKKQLEGLYDKSKRINGIPPGRLAALEALIKKMPNRFKSDLPANKPLIEKNPEAQKWIADILEKFPEHKRVLFLKAKVDQQALNTTEINELHRFHKILLSKKNE